MSDLHRAFVDAFEPYVRERVAEVLGDIDVAGLDEAIASGRHRLDEELARLLAEEPAEQRSSPLQLFQAAIEVPTTVLRHAGVPPTERDPAAEAALPGDVYDLAPASSRSLGDDAWHAHVSWGIAKAEAVAGMVLVTSPAGSVSAVAAIVSVDLMDRSKFEAAAREAGYDLVVWRNPGAVESGIRQRRPAVVFVDLGHRAADEVLRLLVGASARVIAYGPHVDDIGLARARSLGADEAVPRSRLFTRLTRYFPPLA